MGAAFWTPDRVEILKTEWPLSSASEIADMIGCGCTRNMAVGKAWRLMLPDKDRSEAQRRVWARLTPDERKLWGRNIHVSIAKNRGQRIANISECKVAI